MRSALLLACLLAAGCSRNRDEPASLTVAAAANLTDTFAEIAKRFQAETGISVVYSFGATANLEMQAEHSAPFDVFASADVEHVDRLDRKGLLAPGSRAVYARGKLVLWAPPGARVRVTRIEDLANPEVRHVAIANPQLAPYGQAAVEALKNLRLWDSVQNRIVYAGSISMAKQYAKSGNTEAAFTSYSLVIRSGGKIIPVPENLHSPLDQAIAVLRSSPRQRQAIRFVDFVLSDTGREILSRYGYGLPARK